MLLSVTSIFNKATALYNYPMGRYSLCFDWNLASSLVSRGQNGVWPRETTSSPGSCVRKEEREPGTQNFFTHAPSSLGNLHTAPLH